MNKLQKVKKALEFYQQHFGGKMDYGCNKDSSQQGYIQAKEALAELNEFMEGDKGEVSDGYHTFNELYEHRYALFANLVKQDPTAWKSKLHEDGTMFDGCFIAGIKTNDGDITYHMPIKDWDLFDCKELDKAPKWDGHTSDDVINRLKAQAVINVIKGKDDG